MVVLVRYRSYTKTWRVLHATLQEKANAVDVPKWGVLPTFGVDDS